MSSHKAKQLQLFLQADPSAAHSLHQPQPQPRAFQPSAAAVLLPRVFLPLLVSGEIWKQSRRLNKTSAVFVMFDSLPFNKARGRGGSKQQL